MLCKACHTLKYPKDRKVIDKVKKVGARHAGIKPLGKKKIESRGLRETAEDPHPIREGYAAQANVCEGHVEMSGDKEELFECYGQPTKGCRCEACRMRRAAFRRMGPYTLTEITETTYLVADYLAILMVNFSEELAKGIIQHIESQHAKERAEATAAEADADDAIGETHGNA